jgi:hypothetical protein
MRATKTAHIELCKRISSGEATARELISWWAAMREVDEAWYVRVAPLVVLAYESGVIPIELANEIGAWNTAKYATFLNLIPSHGIRYLPQNVVWNIPSNVTEVRGDMRTTGHGWNTLTGYAALAIGYDTSRVYGWRQLNHPKESGHNLEGYVSIGGRSYSAFTSSILLGVFEDPHKSVEIATLYIRFPRWSTGRGARPLPEIPADMPEEYLVLSQTAATTISLPVTRRRYSYLFDD